MADLSEAQSSQSVKIAGANPSTGIEDNYLEVNSDGSANNRLVGDTDATKIGNISDSLKTTTPDRSGSGSLGALDATVTANTQGLGTVIFNVTGTWVGTIRVEGTLDGSTYTLITATDGSQAIFATQAVNNRWTVNSAGFSQVRLRMSSYTSGSASVVWNAGARVQYVQAWNTNSVSFKTEAWLNDAAGADITVGQKTMANSVPVVIASDQYQLISAINGNIGTQGALTVGTSAIEAKVGGARLTARSSLTVWNNSLVNIYWGYTSGVTTSTGTPIPPSKPVSWDIGDNQPVYLIAGTASNNTRITEA